MPTFEELVEKLTGETASYARRSAILALGRLGDERAVEPLVLALQDEDRYIRREAAKALGELGSPAAIEPLIAALGDSEESVCRSAIIALRVAGDEHAIESLKQLSEDKSFFIRSSNPIWLLLLHSGLSVLSSLGQIGEALRTQEQVTPSRQIIEQRWR